MVQSQDQEDVRSQTEDLRFYSRDSLDMLSSRQASELEGGLSRYFFALMDINRAKRARGRATVVAELCVTVESGL